MYQIHLRAYHSKLPHWLRIDVTGKCAIQIACQKDYHCVTGTLDETLASCINHFHTDAELDCGDTGVFIAGLCYESVMTAPVLTCSEGYEKVGNECVLRTFAVPTLQCEEGFTNVGNSYCEGILSTPPVAYCADLSTPTQIDGEFYCSTKFTDGFINSQCPGNWTYDSTLDLCTYTETMEPQRNCPNDGHSLMFNEESKMFECVYNEYNVALQRCDNPMAEPQMVGGTIDECTIPVRKPTSLACDTAAGYELIKNQCVWTIKSDPIDDCQNGQYDPIANVCYTHRYVSGDYICPEGCSYSRESADCVCHTRVTPVVECPLDCYKSKNNCYKNTVMEDITLCPEGYGYDLTKDLCSKETSAAPTEYCADGSSPVDGICYVTITKDLSMMCPSNYALSGDICVRV